MDFPGSSMVKNPTAMPGESHGLKSLAGYSPWGGKELDTTKAIEHTWYSMLCIYHNLPFLYLCILSLIQFSVLQKKKKKNSLNIFIVSLKFICEILFCKIHS